VNAYCVGERVVIRYGKRQGGTATVLKIRPAEVYEVKTEDGAILFFSGKGLQPTADAEVPRPSIYPT